MPISLSCGCGRALRLRDEYAGKRIRCPECQTVLAVPDSDVETSGFIVDESPQASSSISTRPPEPPARQRPPRDDDDDRPRRKRKRSDTDPMLKDYYRHVGNPRRRSGSGIAISRSIIAGVLMMVIAVVWFVVGLFAGWIFFYPPILFILGLVAVGKGLMGYGDA